MKWNVSQVRLYASAFPLLWSIACRIPFSLSTSTLSHVALLFIPASSAGGASRGRQRLLRIVQPARLLAPLASKAHCSRRCREGRWGFGG